MKSLKDKIQSAIKDYRLSYRDLGVLISISEIQETCDPTIKILSERKKDGKQGIEKSLYTLTDLNYLTIEQRNQILSGKTPTKRKDASRELSLKNFDIFWNHYHSHVKVPTSDKAQAQEAWLKMQIEDQRLAYKHVIPYSKTKPESEHQYLGKAYKYLSKRRFENDMKTLNSKPGYTVKKTKFSHER